MYPTKYLLNVTEILKCTRSGRSLLQAVLDIPATSSLGSLSEGIRCVTASNKQKALADTRAIFLLGKRAILKCLLDMKKTFQFDETRHALNRLYIDDYCIYVQSVG